MVLVAPTAQRTLDVSPPVTTTAMRAPPAASAATLVVASAPVSTSASVVAPPAPTPPVTTESSVPTSASTPAMVEACMGLPLAEAARPVASTVTPSASRPDPTLVAPPPMRIKLKVSAPAPAPSPRTKPKAAAPRRSVSVLPVRDDIYNLPSDDDDDMIECEPDPEDIKPVILPKRPEPAPVKPSQRGPSSIDRDADEERERKRRKREKFEEEREETRRKDARRRAKEEEKERLREKEKAREREGKRAALAAWKKPSDTDSFKSASGSKSTGSLKDARLGQSSSKPSSIASHPAPPKPVPQQSIFIKKPAPLTLAPWKPPVETPLFSRATPGPSIDLTAEDSSPAPHAEPPVSLKRPARPSSPIEEEPFAERPAPSGRQIASGKQTSQLLSSVFSFLESGEVEQIVRDEHPVDEPREKAKDDAFISITDDEGENEAPIRPKFYGESSAHPSSSSRPIDDDTAMDVDATPAPTQRRKQRPVPPPVFQSREGSAAPLPPSNMETAVPVEVKTDNDMPAIDANLVTQMHKGRGTSRC